MVCKKNNFINHSWLIGGNRVGFVTCRFIIFVFDGPVFQFVNCLGLTQDLRFRSVACHLLSPQNRGNKGVSQLSWRLLLCAYQGGFVQFMYAASLALFRDIHSQMFLGLPFFFFCGGTKTWKWFSRQEKRWKSAEDPKQKSKTGYYPPKRELGQLRSHLFLYCTWFGNKFHFLHFLVDGQKSCTNFW